MSRRFWADPVRRFLFAVFFILLIETGGSTALAQQAARPASAPAPAAQTKQAAPVAAADALQDAEHRAAIAEAKAELMEAANGRLEIWIGAFGILITVMLALAGFFTWRSAAHAARAEVQEMRDALNAIKTEAQTAKEAIDRLASDATEKHKGIADISADLLARANAQPGKDHEVPVSEEDRQELAEIEREIETQPEAQWSAVQFRLMLIGAEAKKDWHRYVELADQMARAHGEDASERAYALFAKAHGHSQLRNYAKAAEAYAYYLEECPEDSPKDRINALVNWGSMLSSEALAKQAAGDHAGADRLWALAGEKYQAALTLEPGKPEALDSWGGALVSQASFRSGRSRNALFKRGEKMLNEANDRSPGSASYNLACLAGLREDAPGAARWLRDAQAHNRRWPSCAHIDTDRDLDSVRETPEFQQALIDVGCGPAPTIKPKRRAARRPKS